MPAGQDRKDLIADMRLQKGACLLIDRVAAQDENARLVQQDAQVAPDFCWLAIRRSASATIPLNCCAGVSPSTERCSTSAPADP